jgi:hypothetical protein
MKNSTHYKKIIDKFGVEKQIIVAIEELSELQKALCKHLREKGDILAITEEMADVYIMLEQLEFIFSNSRQLEDMKEMKIRRTVERYL